MNKSHLIVWLEEEQQNLLALISEIPVDLVGTPGVNGEWSVKDLIAHLTTYHIDHIFCLEAAFTGKEPPDPPWPIGLESLDATNKWIFNQNKDRVWDEVIAENQKVFNDLIKVVKQFPDGH